MPIHLFWGDDQASIDHAIKKLIKKIIEPAWSSINFTRLDGSNALQASQALEEARTPPFGTGGRLVLLQRSPFCNNCPTELALGFESALQQIPEQSHLVLNNPNKPDGRLKTTKALERLIKQKKAQESHYVLPAMWDIQGQKQLVERTAHNLGLALETEAAQALIDAIGADSYRLSSELEKLALHAEVKKCNENEKNELTLISLKSVNELIRGMATNSLQIGEMLLASNFGEAIAKLDALLEKGEPALKITATLSGQIRGWLWISMLDQQGERDVSVIAKAAGINNPKRIYVLRKQLQGKQPEHFLKLLSCLLEIEASLKMGALPRNAFQDALLDNYQESFPHTEIIS